MDSNDAAKVVGQLAGSHREGLFMVWKDGASGDEPLVTPSGHVLTASEAILLSMYAHATNALAKQLGAKGTEEITLPHEMTSLAVEVGKLYQLWFGDSE